MCHVSPNTYIMICSHSNKQWQYGNLSVRSNCSANFCTWQNFSSIPFIFATAQFVQCNFLLTDRPTDWPTDRPTDWPTDWLTNLLTDWPTDWLTDQPTDRLTKPLNTTGSWITAKGMYVARCKGKKFVAGCFSVQFSWRLIQSKH